MNNTENMDVNASNSKDLICADLIQDYVGVCNQAIEENANRFPFQQILGAAREMNTAQEIEVNILDWGHKETYVFVMGRKGLSVKSHDECGACSCVRSWSVSKDYLEQVAEESNSYIKNPAKMNWDWMYDV